MITRTYSDRLTRFREQLAREPIMKKTVIHIEELHDRYGDEYLDLADKVLETSESLGWNTCGILTNVFFECIQEMLTFNETGNFGDTSFDEIRQTVYENKEYMEGQYLPGLFIAYAFTPLLYPKYPFFRNNFLPRLNADMQGVEVGFGDGFYLWVMCQNVPGIRPQGFDISPSALVVARKLLESSGFRDCTLELGNVLEALPLPDASQDWGILAEVIEHIPTPEKGIAEMARILRPGACLYLSTTKDYNHVDHITNFPSVEYVADLIAAGGFVIQEQMSYKIQDDYPESPDKSENMAFICERI